MAINILMPALSPTMTEGKLAKWHVKEGDKVTAGQVICEIETDKATMEVEAVDEGKIGKIVVPGGAEGVKVNAVIAILLEEGGTAPPAGPQPVFVAPGDKRVPHTSIRKVIARRMLESKQTVPHFYLTVDLEIDALLAARQAINAVAEKKGTKVSVNDMVIKACAKALRDHPECNASWTDDEMSQYAAVHISLALAPHPLP